MSLSPLRIHYGYLFLVILPLLGLMVILSELTYISEIVAGRIFTVGALAPCLYCTYQALVQRKVYSFGKVVPRSPAIEESETGEAYKQEDPCYYYFEHTHRRQFIWGAASCLAGTMLFLGCLVCTHPAVKAWLNCGDSTDCGTTTFEIVVSSFSLIYLGLIPIAALLVWGFITIYPCKR